MLGGSEWVLPVRAAAAREWGREVEEERMHNTPLYFYNLPFVNDSENLIFESFTSQTATTAVT